MAIIPQSSCFSSLDITTTATLSSPKLTLFSKPFLFKTLLSSSLNPSNAQSSIPTSSNSSETSSQPVKLAFAKAKAYKKNPVLESEDVESDSGSDGVGEGTKEVPVSVKMAMEKAKEYKKNKGIVVGSSEEKTTAGLKEGNGRNSGSGYVEKVTCPRWSSLLGIPATLWMQQCRSPSQHRKIIPIFTSQRFLHGESFLGLATFRKHLVVEELFALVRCLKQRKIQLLKKHAQDNYLLPTRKDWLKY